MVNKKNETRFTIKFNSKNPRHNEAVQILNNYGKGMSSLIADALCLYVHHGANMDSELADKVRYEKNPAHVEKEDIHKFNTALDAFF